MPSVNTLYFCCAPLQVTKLRAKYKVVSLGYAKYSNKNRHPNLDTPSYTPIFRHINWTHEHTQLDWHNLKNKLKTNN